MFDSVKPSAAEALKAAIRRAIPLTLGLIILGAVATVTLKQLQGPQYTANARIALSSANLGAMLSGIDPGFVDPERQAETALALARSPETYRRAAELLDSNREGSELRAMTAVTGDDDSDIIRFSTTAGDRREAASVVNAVAQAYVDWRADLSAREIRTAIAQVQARLTNPSAPQEVLREQLERLRTLETLNSGGATVIDRASRGSQVSPAPVRDTILGASIGLVIGLLLAGAREALNTRVRSEGDVEDVLGKPVLATIQSLPRRVRLVTIGRHEMRFGDTYGLLAANLMQLSSDSDPKVLAVTSAVAGEGKTTTASNLAVAMARRGQKVVLADFDLRKPSIGQFFRIPPDSPGVIQLVDGEVELDSTVWSVPLNGTTPSGRATPPEAWSGNGAGRAQGEEQAGWLRVVPSGGAERGARAARSLRIPTLLEDLGKGADIVIIDTPPALATVEMAELAPNIDYVLVCVRHGRVARRSLQTLSRQAESWNAEIVGAVLTDSPLDTDDHSDYAA
jgi:succinoglycan biosynthesis transport protein ExoP